MKLVRVFALERGVKGFDGGHVRVKVARGLKDGAQAASFAAVIQIRQHDRDLGADGNVIEAGLPVACFAATAFWGHGELQRAGGGLDGRDRRSNHVIGFLSVHGQAAQPHHQPPKGRPEQVFFAHPVQVKPQGKSDHQGVGQVPVAGVGRCNKNAFLSTRWQAAFHPPSGEFEVGNGERAQHSVDNRRGKNSAVHEDGGCGGAPTGKGRLAAGLGK